MGFTTGLGMPTMMGLPEYYIDDEQVNQWDENTYLNLSFDFSGSMNTIIAPIIAVVDGAYLASPGVKASNSLRALLQDFYATGVTEENGNTDATTNGKDEYEDHVGFRVVNNERYLTWFENYYPARNGASAAASVSFANHQKWVTLAGSNTISNIVQITLSNENRPQYLAAQAYGDGYYHRSHFGSPINVDVTCTVDGATSSSATFVSDTAYGDGTGGTVRDELTFHNHPDYFPSCPSGCKGNMHPFKLHARSSGGSITANTLIKLINIDVGGGEDGKTVTLDNADHSFVDGETLTFRVSNPGWDNTDVMTNWSTDVVALRESLLSGDVTTNSIHGVSYDPGGGLSGIASTGQYPSIHYIHIDPGGDGSIPVTGLSGSSKPDGPQPDPANYDPGGGLPDQTASQRVVSEGLHQGLGEFGADTSDSNKNKSLNDYEFLASTWNGKVNTFVPLILDSKSAETSGSYWYGQLHAAITIGMTI